MLSCAALQTILDRVPSNCPKCFTPLLQVKIELEDTPTNNNNEGRLYFCVTCRKDHVVAKSLKFDEFFEKSQGTLIFVENPFEAKPGWIRFLRERIIAYVCKLFHALH